MDKIKQHLDRQIFYLSPRQAKNWADSLPADNWAVLLIADNFENSPLTVSDDNLEEEFWFALTTAHHPNFDIKEIICFDLTDEGQKEKLLDLLTKINLGWLPSDRISFS